MNADQETKELLASLRGYLEELQESGVDGLPYDTPSMAVPEPNKISAEPTKREDLDCIREELGDCHRCSLGDLRNKLVYGSGSGQARLVFVGEAPGAEEDRLGEPFVGEAGQLLTNIIQAMGFRREEVYICNVLKCRPPKNRDPLPEEVAACSAFMKRQVQAINPEVVIALGKFAAQTLLQTKETISRLRGQFHDYHGIPLMPTFHPSALLRDPAKKKDVWADMQQVMKRLGKEVPVKKRD